MGVCGGRGGGGVAASSVSRNKRTVNICPCTSHMLRRVLPAHSPNAAESLTSIWLVRYGTRVNPPFKRSYSGVIRSRSIVSVSCCYPGQGSAGSSRLATETQ